MTRGMTQQMGGGPGGYDVASSSKLMNMENSELDRALHTSVMKREQWKEEEFRSKKESLDETTRLGFGGTEMTKEEMRKIIDKDRRMYYRTEELNDKLYIHYKGWTQLQNLEGWTGLKAMYAECNAFNTMKGLENCRSLRSLFLQENCIKKIEGLENCHDLWNLNVSSNFIEKISGLKHLKKLNTLVIAKNKVGIRCLDDLSELVGSSIHCLDIQDNKISDPDVVPEILMRMPNLRVLYLKGNPCSKKIVNYRKGITANCGELRYLDDRPVFPEDRRSAEAFNRGGLEEERAERKRIREEKSKAHDDNMAAFQRMIVRARLEKREKDAMRAEDKYTEDDDPGLYNEQQMKFRKQRWEEENAEDLKDHDLERAKRILKEEKERGLHPTASGQSAVNLAAPGGESSHAEQHAAEFELGGEDDMPDVDDTTASTEEARAEELRAMKEEGQSKPKDERKLIYEDIWDDSPPAWYSKGDATAATEKKAAGQVKKVENSPGFNKKAAEKSEAAQKQNIKESILNPKLSASEEDIASGGVTWYERYKSKMNDGVDKLEQGLQKAGAKVAPGQDAAVASQRSAEAAASIRNVKTGPAGGGVAAPVPVGNLFVPPPRKAPAGSYKAKAAREDVAEEASGRPVSLGPPQPPTAAAAAPPKPPAVAAPKLPVAADFDANTELQEMD